MAVTTKWEQDFEIATTEQIEKAKNFLWDYLDVPNKVFLIHQVEKVSKGTNKLSIEKVTIGFQFH